MVVIGSSPLTRGTLAFDDASYSAARFIPAYAGNSAPDGSHRLLLPVHPRLRGELSRSTTPPTVLLGSSPLTRGTQHRTEVTGFCCRFIPAYAGNSKPRDLPSSGRSVHPRLRGELGNAAEAISSVVRFIPAYAGNSRRQFVKRLNISVHPRLRGELECKPFYGLDFGGSSPLTRGTLITWSDYLTYFRFIPAYAGNSEWRLRSRLLQPVHPRLRGELWHRHDQINLKAGSSPLTRGTPEPKLNDIFKLRFIPAYAGNSLAAISIR